MSPLVRDRCGGLRPPSPSLICDRRSMCNTEVRSWPGLASWETGTNTFCWPRHAGSELPRDGQAATKRGHLGSAGRGRAGQKGSRVVSLF